MTIYLIKAVYHGNRKDARENLEEKRPTTNRQNDNETC